MSKRAHEGGSELTAPNKRILCNIAPASTEHPRTDRSAVIENQHTRQRRNCTKSKPAGRPRSDRSRETEHRRILSNVDETVNAILARYPYPPPSPSNRATLRGFRIRELEDEHRKEQDISANGMLEEALQNDPKQMYKKFYDKLKNLCSDYVCGSCGCLSHDREKMELYPKTDSSLLLLKRPDAYDVRAPYSSGVTILDEKDIMIDRKSVCGDSIWICLPCHNVLRQKRRPRKALANYRWVDDVPEQLKGLTFIEEQLIARAHFVGSILRLQKRAGAAYHSIKGHVVLVPQETRKLATLLPLMPAELTENVQVVWIGNTVRWRPSVEKYCTIRKDRVLDALKWLIENHEDYKGVLYDPSRWSHFASEFVAAELLDTVTLVSEEADDAALRFDSP
jgi:hypothetical protein